MLHHQPVVFLSKPNSLETSTKPFLLFLKTLIGIHSPTIIMSFKLSLLISVIVADVAIPKSLKGFVKLSEKNSNFGFPFKPTFFNIYVVAGNGY